MLNTGFPPNYQCKCLWIVNLKTYMFVWKTSVTFNLINVIIQLSIFNQLLNHLMNVVYNLYNLLLITRCHDSTRILKESCSQDYWFAMIWHKCFFYVRSVSFLFPLVHFWRVFKIKVILSNSLFKIFF